MIPLPPRVPIVSLAGTTVWGYTADQLRAYADAVRTEERERTIKIIEAYQIPVGNSAAGEMAAQWTLDALREIRDEIRKGPT